MPYQEVNSCRFYINTLEWLASKGVITLPSEHFRTLPVTPTEFFNITEAYTLPSGVFDNNCFFAVLGHTRASDGAGIDLYLHPHGEAGTVYGDTQINVGVANASQGSSVPEYNGFSLATLPYVIENFVLLCYGYYGSIILGTYYDMPHSPDLNLTMSREMDGFRRIRTKGGNDLTDYKYKRSPNWGEAAPWELYSGDYTLPLHKLLRNGRRVWDLSWSYLASKDVMGAPEFLYQRQYTEAIAGTGSSTGSALTDLGWDDSDVTDSDSFDSNLLNHNDFFSQVIHKTNGGQLPFIFQPNKNDPTVLAICKLQNKFSFQQISPGLYNVKLRIKEVW